MSDQLSIDSKIMPIKLVGLPPCFLIVDQNSITLEVQKLLNKQRQRSRWVACLSLAFSFGSTVLTTEKFQGLGLSSEAWRSVFLILAAVSIVAAAIFFLLSLHYGMGVDPEEVAKNLKEKSISLSEPGSVPIQ